MIENCLKCGNELKFRDPVYIACGKSYTTYPLIATCPNCGKAYSVKPFISYDVIPYYGTDLTDSFGHQIKD